MRQTLFSRYGRINRFMMVGVLNTLFGLGIYALFIWLGSPTWLALAGGNLAGLAFNFLTTGGLVFADCSPARIPRFVAAYTGLYCLNLVLIHRLTTLMGRPILSQVILTPFMAIVAYLLMSRVVFTSPTSKAGKSQ
ncbi:GtrA family protein [Paraburkholderia hayleyella]|uniref:GtrA family protein n=1 Tax=Paraburkholderia hayleyella TaxID=2152889 RepID=UPI001580980B|nr:GtrA family protein [Paraburkholderia hayleyella]